MPIDNFGEKTLWWRVHAGGHHEVWCDGQGHHIVLSGSHVGTAPTAVNPLRRGMVMRIHRQHCSCYSGRREVVP